MCWAHAPAPCPGPPDLGETVRQAASRRPGMQPAWAAPCPNQFEPAAGMEPWLSPRAPPGAQAQLRAAAQASSSVVLPGYGRPSSQPGVGVPVTARPSRPPGTLEAPSWAPRSHSLPPPLRLASPPAAKWLPVCVFSRSVLCLGPQAHQVLD